MGESELDRPLWVCWAWPSRPFPIPSTVLSFLPPDQEAELEGLESITVIRARELSLKVREAARRAYLDLVARIGTVPNREGVTLRQALGSPGRASRWWYHPLSFKDAERDPLFQSIVALFTVKAATETRRASRLILVGCPDPIARVLRQAFAVDTQAVPQADSMGTRLVRGLVARMRCLFTLVRIRWVVGSSSGWPSCSVDVLLQGFWDWSVWWDEQRGGLYDRYFQAVPQLLAQPRGESVGWMLWVEPDFEPGKRGRVLSNVVASLRRSRNTLVLQSYLRWRDIFRAVADLGPLLTCWASSRREAFQRACQHENWDFAPLVAGGMLEGLASPDLALGELMALAVERAVREANPASIGCFLEHFPRSRAVYEGSRRAKPRILCWTIQHASYSHEKTFLVLSPEREFNGTPDGCAVPHPDVVFAMGEYGRSLFLECGYADDRVVATGSPRFDHVRMRGVHVRQSGLGAPQGGMRILLVASQAVEYELDMIAAVTAATKDDESCELIVTSHPFSPVEAHSGFLPFRGRVSVTRQPWAEAIRTTDLVLFTYSTVAEEAFLLGMPVWQWLPWQFHGSALGEVLPIPRFASVPALRQALKAFRADPARFYPTAEQQAIVEERLFYRADGRGAERVTTALRAFSSTREAIGLA